MAHQHPISPASGSKVSGGELSIGELSRRTGVPIATIRSWESRHGFPRPRRQDGGHRRYDASDVDAVRGVLERRRSGLSLAAAIERTSTPGDRSGSVFAELRRRHPALAPHVLTRRTLLAMSRAIEDECCARAAPPLLFGGFQREVHLRAAMDRWRELARTARRAVVFADLPDPAPLADGVPVEVALPPDAALNREWLVVCDAADLPACLAAVELPGRSGAGAGERTFEAVWSLDPRVVRDASRECAALADDYRPGWRSAGVPWSDDTVLPASEDLRRASQLFERMVSYLDATR
ncbi:hypothetical protein GCM10009641_73890 [Mycobacterium cookii]|uniref:HTH merR-type domain-containing protein n=1 Tax=Nocardioides furvisabuli TaxID=375542 RepID=A0ABN2WUN5_9ACTN|nr:DICT sensory domain-containing protein [Nocardioides furvisabuli]